jgi:hypothetical protein
MPPQANNLQREPMTIRCNLGQQVQEGGRNPERRRDDDRPAPADAFRQPAPEQRREKESRVGKRDRQRDQGRAQLEIELQMRREQRVVRIVDDKGARHHQAGGQRVAEYVEPEDREQRGTHLTVLQRLLASVLDPDLGFFDVYESR